MTFEELGQHQHAAAAYRRALELPGNEAEERFLISALQAGDKSTSTDSR